ncbi:receptor-like protein 34 [Cryptomeria japonica]|uniref:receptor-like protein 34 n=1 Tax=Cryptomeria japonica TaxID=3369 RepID=UPI0027DAA35C|nr:receptor-like protein 34 [Cryptomeria japonica]
MAKMAKMQQVKERAYAQDRAKKPTPLQKRLEGGASVEEPGSGGALVAHWQCFGGAPVVLRWWWWWLNGAGQSKAELDRAELGGAGSQAEGSRRGSLGAAVGIVEEWAAATEISGRSGEDRQGETGCRDNAGSEGRRGRRQAYRRVGLAGQSSYGGWTVNMDSYGIPLELTKLENLQVLILSNNNLSGAIPSSLRNLRAMANQTESAKVLKFSNSSSMPYLDKIEINNKGLVLEYVKSLALVRCLDLSNNNFSGDIPQEIGFLIGLRILNLSMNQLHGKIPTSFGNLVQLESLDLSDNNLIGNIPNELQSLTFLSYLNISCNNFSSRIPQGAQWLTFDERSFSNNANLCGLQININCSPSSPSNKIYDEDVSEHEWEEHVWWEVGIGLSFGFGFSIVIGVLCFNKNCRKRCFKVMDDIIVILDQSIQKKIF